MPNANTYKVGRTPMNKPETYTGPILSTDGLVYFTISAPTSATPGLEPGPADSMSE